MNAIKESFPGQDLAEFQEKISSRLIEKDIIDYLNNEVKLIK
jgi:hypothetical protein